MRYTHKDHGDKVFQFEKAEKDHCVFTHKPLFTESVEVKSDWANLKHWKPSKKGLPTLCPTAVLEKRIITISEPFNSEMKKAELTSILLKAFADNSKGLVKSLAFAHNPFGLYTTCKYKKGELVLYPRGHLTLIKAQDLEKVKGCVVQFQGEHFLVSPFKPLAHFDIEADGVLLPYAFVQVSDDRAAINMAGTHVNVKGAKIPVLQNVVSVERQTLLVKAKDSKDKGQVESATKPIKRRRT